MSPGQQINAIITSNFDRFGEAEKCQWSDEACDEPREGGTHFCATHLPLMRIRYAADSCADESSDSDATGAAA